MSVDLLSDEEQELVQVFDNKHVHTLPHISMNGIPLDDDPLTLDVWEDKEDHFPGKRDKRSVNTSDTIPEHHVNIIKESIFQKSLVQPFCSAL